MQPKSSTGLQPTPNNNVLIEIAGVKKGGLTKETIRVRGCVRSGASIYNRRDSVIQAVHQFRPKLVMKSLRYISLVIVFFVAILWMKSLDRQSKSDDYVEQAVAIVQSIPEYAQNKDFIDSRLAKHHERAFEVAYKSGRLKSSLDEKSYRIVLLSLFMDDAEAADNTVVFEAMRRELKKLQP